MANEPTYWFPRKRYGWGWGPPRTWHGWAVLLVYFALVALGIRWISPARDTGLLFAYIAMLTILLMLVVSLKGERPRWQWGKRVD